MSEADKIRAIAIEMATSPVVKAVLAIDPKGVVTKQIESLLVATDDIVENIEAANDVFRVIALSATRDSRNRLIADVIVKKIGDELLRILGAG